MSADLIERMRALHPDAIQEDVSDAEFAHILVDLVAANYAALRAKDTEREELAALVRRLSRALRVAHPGSVAAQQALDYLRRKGLVGNILREGEPDTGDSVAVIHRPADCKHPLTCGWHELSTDPPLGLFGCDQFDCPHSPHAARGVKNG